ncbi:hypothetical protein Tco_0525689 [Tanacetum coccineum]
MRYSRPFEEQPLPAATLPIADSPGYVPESDPEEEPEEDDEDPEEDPADYPADREDDDDDDDEDEDEDEEEEEEHPAPADSVPPVHQVERLLALTTPPPSPLTPLSSPLPQIPSPPPNSPTHIEIPKSCLPLRKREPSRRLNRSTLKGGSIRGCYQSFTTVEQAEYHHVGYDRGCSDDRSLLRARVNLLYRDRPVHRRLAVMIEREARMAREAWGLSMDASDYARSDVMSLHTTVVAQSALISELQSADHRRQGVIKELWASDHKRQVQLTKALQLLKGLQTQMTEFQRQHGPAKGSAQPDAPGEAGSSS